MYDFNHLYEPASAAEAVEMMQAHPKAKIIAGGSDLLVQLRDGINAGCDFISIYMIDELRGISIDAEKNIRIGALTSFSIITKNKIIQDNVPVLGEAADTVGGPQIRNIGTIGGNICNGHTGADTAGTLFALDAMVELTGPDGKKIIPIAQFYKPTGGVDLKPAQLLTAVIIPEKCYTGYVGCYYKYAARNAMDVDIVGCSVNVRLSEDKTVIEDVRAAFGVVGPNPVRVILAENKVRGSRVYPGLAGIFADAAVEEIHPRTDFRGTKEFRLHMAHEIVKRMFTEAVKKAGGDI